MGEINLVSVNISATQKHKKTVNSVGKNLISKLGWDRRKSNILGPLRENKYSVD